MTKKKVKEEERKRRLWAAHLKVYKILLDLIQRYLGTSQASLRVKRISRMHHRTIFIHCLLLDIFHHRRWDAWTQRAIEVGWVKVHRWPFLWMVRWCIPRTWLSLVCEVIRYRWFEPRQSLSGKFQCWTPQYTKKFSSMKVSSKLTQGSLSEKKLSAPVCFTMESVRIRRTTREIATKPLILCIELGGKPKRLP